MKVTDQPSEHRARRIVRERAAGYCEISGAANPTDMSHRKARSAGGQWEASNLLHVTHDVHMWLHANPAAARAGGWIVPSWGDPAVTPVWLERPYRGWFQLCDRGFLTSVDPEDFSLPVVPVVPVLPERRAA